MNVKIDFHVHSNYSFDSKSMVKDIINTAKLKKLNGVAIVDHNCFDSYNEIKDINQKDILIIPGVEYSTTMGHFLVYFLKQGLEKQSIFKYKTGKYDCFEIIEAAHEQGAVVYIAHPFKPYKTFKDSIIEKLDGAEVYNSRASLCRNRNANMQALDLVKQNDLPFVAGSDGHWLSEIGNSYWEGTIDTFNLNSVKKAILQKQGKAFVSHTPIYYEAASQIYKYSRQKKYHKIPKQVIKACYGGVTELSNKLRLAKLEKPHYIYPHSCQ